MKTLEGTQNSPRRPVKALLARVNRIQRGFKMLHRQGKTWPMIGATFGRSPTWACRIARGQYTYWTEESISYIEERLPAPLWETQAELDGLVLLILVMAERRKGKDIAKECGTLPQTIRKSIKRLRENGHNISASMAPPRGYRLEEGDGGNPQEG